MEEILENAGILDKEGNVVNIEDLKNRKVVAFYFSAHWCPPCRSFTPLLIKFYEFCKAEEKDFEVVFISGDQDQAAFDGYYNDMPWYCIRYEDQAIIKDLHNWFQVKEQPCLVVCKGDDWSLQSKSGRKDIYDKNFNAYTDWVPIVRENSPYLKK